MPQHMAPRGLLPSQCAQDSSRSVLFGLTDISKIQGIGCRKLSVFGLPVCRAVQHQSCAATFARTSAHQITTPCAASACNAYLHQQRLQLIAQAA